MPSLEQQAFARKYAAVISEAHTTGAAVELRAGMAHTDKPCCDLGWSVRMWLYLPLRIWIVRCSDCNAVWTESTGGGR